MNTSTNYQNLSESLDSAIFCGLLDAGFDPAEAAVLTERSYSDLDEELSA